MAYDPTGRFASPLRHNFGSHRGLQCRSSEPQNENNVKIPLLGIPVIARRSLVDERRTRIPVHLYAPCITNASCVFIGTFVRGVCKVNWNEVGYTGFSVWRPRLPAFNHVHLCSTNRDSRIAYPPTLVAAESSNATPSSP